LEGRGVLDLLEKWDNAKGKSISQKNNKQNVGSSKSMPKKLPGEEGSGDDKGRGVGGISKSKGMTRRNFGWGKTLPGERKNKLGGEWTVEQQTITNVQG